MSAADQDADRGQMVVPAHLVINDGDAEAELPDERWLELSRLELDDDVSELLDVEEEQVHKEVVAVDVEMSLPSDERESRTELAKRFDDAIHRGLLEVPFRRFVSQVKE